MKEQQNITIKIADVAPISLTISRDTEVYVREAEYNVNLVWQRWRKDFSDKTSKEILAMVAYQFAKLYYQQQHYVDNEREMLKNFEADLDELLRIDGDEASDAVATEAIADKDRKR